jgi:choline dehydrogenase-like flavoprotein
LLTKLPTKPDALESGVVVVGAGSAGAALAGRLAERGRSVTLLEAGPDWHSEDWLPELRHPSPEIFAWKVDVRPPEGYFWPGLRATRMAGRPATLYVRGRGLGGTSAINGLVVIRPPLEEFDDWEIPGWSAADVLPYFVRLEDDIDYGDAPYHGRGGPTPVVRRPESAWGSMDEVLASAALEVGHPEAPDHNAPGSFGVSRTAMNVRMGVRVTTNDGYLEPVRNRGNLRVVCDALADVVLFRGDRAIGVAARTGNERREFRAENVVLCAGAAATPAILQRSGVGPAGLLGSLGIPIVANLPVGVGIQDHVGFWLSVELESGRTARNGARGNCTLRYSSGEPGSGVGDLLMVSANPLSSAPNEGALGVKLARCFSRGSLAIETRDPDASPAIRLNLLEHVRDRVLARHALRDALELLRAGSVARRVAAVRDRYGAELDRAMTDDEIDAWLDRNALDTAHLSGGARLGAAGDPHAVVDTCGRVLGTSGLWVADMSIAPTVPRANTHLTAVMFGERIADAISPIRIEANR